MRKLLPLLLLFAAPAMGQVVIPGTSGPTVVTPVGSRTTVQPALCPGTDKMSGIATGGFVQCATDLTGYLTIEDEGSGLTQRTTVNFIGAGVSCTDNGVKTVCTITGGGGGGTPGGSDTQVQFNDGGVFGGDPDFTWNKTSNIVSVLGAASIDGSADVVQLLVQGSATQTADIFRIESSSAASLLALEADGDLRFASGAKQVTLTPLASGAGGLQVSADDVFNAGTVNEIRFVDNTSFLSLDEAETDCGSSPCLVVVQTDEETGNVTRTTWDETAAILDLRGDELDPFTSGAYYSPFKLVTRKTEAADSVLDLFPSIRVIQFHDVGGDNTGGGPKDTYFTFRGDLYSAGRGQHLAISGKTFQYGSGDGIGTEGSVDFYGNCLESGGECAEAGRFQVNRGSAVFTGTVSSYTGGSRTIAYSSPVNEATLGVDRVIINTTGAKTYTTGSVTSINSASPPVVTGSGTLWSTQFGAGAHTDICFSQADDDSTGGLKFVVPIRSIDSETTLTLDYDPQGADKSWPGDNNGSTYRIYKCALVETINFAGGSLTHATGGTTDWAATDTIEVPVGWAFFSAGALIVVSNNLPAFIVNGLEITSVSSEEPVDRMINFGGKASIGLRFGNTWECKAGGVNCNAAGFTTGIRFENTPTVGLHFASVTTGVPIALRLNDQSGATTGNTDFQYDSSAERWDLTHAASTSNQFNFFVAGANAGLSIGTTWRARTSFQSNNGDIADAGVLRLGNAECIAWEASPSGTDVTLCADASEIIQITGGTLDGADLTSGSVTATQLGTDSVSADELNATGVEAELEAVLDLADLQGDLALGTKTSGNYIASLTSGIGLTGFPAAGEGATGTPAFDFSDAGASPALGADEARFTSNATVAGFLVFEGDTADTFETRIVIADPTADRAVFVANADTATGQAVTCGGTDKVSAFNAATGAFTCTADVSGGSPTWNSIANPVGAQALTMGANNTTWTWDSASGTFLSTHSSAFSTGSQFKVNATGAFTGGTLFEIAQETGNPTAGSLMAIRAADVNVTEFLRLDHSGDADVVLAMDAGSTAMFGNFIDMSDRGTRKFRMGKGNGVNDFLLFEDASGTNRLYFSAAAENNYSSGATTGDHVFTSTTTERFRILGSAFQVNLGSGTNLSTWTHTGMVFEGAGDNGFETTLSITDPTADRTVIFPDAGGEVSLLAQTIGTAEIENDAVTYAKIQNVSATDRLLGRDTAAAGDIEELTATGGIEFTGSGIQTSAFTGDVTKAAGGTALTIADNAVTTAKILDANVTAAKVAAVLRTRQAIFVLGADNGAALGDTDDQATIYVNRLGQGITITEVLCESDAGTPSINLQRDDGTPANILSANLSCSTSGATGTIDGAEDNVANAERIDFVMVSAGGTAKRVTVAIKFTLD